MSKSHPPQSAPTASQTAVQQSQSLLGTEATFAAAAAAMNAVLNKAPPSSSSSSSGGMPSLNSSLNQNAAANTPGTSSVADNRNAGNKFKDNNLNNLGSEALTCERDSRRSTPKDDPSRPSSSASQNMSDAQASFNVETILHPSSKTPNPETDVPGRPDSAAANLLSGPYTKQNTPMSDDCNSIESPLSVDSSKDNRKRDIAEERQKLRSYRITKHLSSKTSSSVTPTSSANTTGNSTTSSSSSKTTSSTSNSSTTGVCSKKSSSTAPAAAVPITCNTSSTSVNVASSSKTSSAISTTASGASSTSVCKSDITKSTAAVSKANPKRSSTSTPSTNNHVITAPLRPATAGTPIISTAPVSSAAAAPFLNSSFFVPGTSTFSGFPHPYSFSGNPFIPLFGTHSFPGVSASGVPQTPPPLSQTSVAQTSGVVGQSPKTSTVGVANRYIQSSLAPSNVSPQLTIFTSPNANPSPNSLSPFSFPLGPSAHLLSPSFPSGLGASATGSAPLLIPKFPPNFLPGTSLEQQQAAAHSLLMYNLASQQQQHLQKATSGVTSSTSNSSSLSSHTLPPFILPRTVANVQTSSTPSSIAANNSTAPVVVSSPSATPKGRPKMDRDIQRLSKLFSKKLTPQPVILPSTAAQPAGLAPAILQPQTLFVLQQQPMSAVTTASTTTSTTTTTSSQKKSPGSKAKATISITNTTSTTTASISTPLTTPSSGLISTVRPPLPVSGTGFPVSTPGPLILQGQTAPYATFFTPPAGTAQTLMQPISIQAPPPPPQPTNLLAPQLLLSVISPTHGHQTGSTNLVTSPQTIQPALVSSTGSKNIAPKSVSHQKEITTNKPIKPKIEVAPKNKPILATPVSAAVSATTKPSATPPATKKAEPMLIEESRISVQNYGDDRTLQFPYIKPQPNIELGSVKVKDQNSVSLSPITSVGRAPQSERVSQSLGSPIANDELASLVKSVQDNIDSFNADDEIMMEELKTEDSSNRQESTRSTSSASNRKMNSTEEVPCEQSQSEDERSNSRTSDERRNRKKKKKKNKKHKSSKSDDDRDRKSSRCSRRKSKSEIRDPQLLSKIDDIIDSLTSCHLSSASASYKQSTDLPAMFRVSLPKLSRNARTSGKLVGPWAKPCASTGTQITDKESTRCLPLKKRAHRNLDGEQEPCLTPTTAQACASTSNASFASAAISSGCNTATSVRRRQRANSRGALAGNASRAAANTGIQPNQESTKVPEIQSPGRQSVTGIASHSGDRVSAGYARDTQQLWPVQQSQQTLLQQQNQPSQKSAQKHKQYEPLQQPHHQQQQPQQQQRELSVVNKAVLNTVADRTTTVEVRVKEDSDTLHSKIVNSSTSAKTIPTLKVKTASKQNTKHTPTTSSSQSRDHLVHHALNELDEHGTELVNTTKSTKKGYIVSDKLSKKDNKKSIKSSREQSSDSKLSPISSKKEIKNKSDHNQRRRHSSSRSSTTTSESDADDESSDNESIEVRLTRSGRKSQINKQPKTTVNNELKGNTIPSSVTQNSKSAAKTAHFSKDDSIDKSAKTKQQIDIESGKAALHDTAHLNANSETVDGESVDHAKVVKKKRRRTINRTGFTKPKKKKKKEAVVFVSHDSPIVEAQLNTNVLNINTAPANNNIKADSEEEQISNNTVDKDNNCLPTPSKTLTKTKASPKSKATKKVSETESETESSGSEPEEESEMAASQANKRNPTIFRDLKNKIKSIPKPSFKKPEATSKIVKSTKKQLNNKKTLVKDAKKKIAPQVKKPVSNNDKSTIAATVNSKSKSIKNKNQPDIKVKSINNKTVGKTVAQKNTSPKTVVTKHNDKPAKNSDSTSQSDTNSDSENSSTESSSALTSEDEQMTSQYPIFMVTKSTPKSGSSSHSKQKVFPIKPNPFQRSLPEKKFFKVGVFSRDFYEAHPDDLEILKSVKNMEATSTNTATIPGVSTAILEQRSVLPLPNFLLQDSGTRQKRSTSKHVGFMAPLADQTDGFSLRFDIWYQHKFNPFPQIMKSANYKRVRQNVFVDVKPTASDVNEKCACEPPTKPDEAGCGEKCENRMFEQECRPTTCPSKSACSNQRIQRYEWWPGLQRFMTAERGWGIRATEEIPEGHFIMEYIGEVCSKQLFEKRMSERYGDDHHHYSLKIDNKMVIDGYRVSNEGRFVNHSCEPNCEIQKWSVNGYYRMCLFSTRKIEPGEELCYDYKFDNYGSKQACRCGSKKCRGVLGKVNEKNRTDSDQDSSEEANNAVPSTTRNDADEQTVSEKPRLRRKILNVLSEDDWAKKLNKVTSDICLNPNEFVFVHQKFKDIAGQANSNEKENVNQKNKLHFDQELMERLSKMKPLTHYSRVAVAKSRVFLLRNYDHSRSFVTSCAHLSKNPAKPKEVDTPTKSYIKNRRTVNGRYGRTEDSSSESDSGICVEKRFNKLEDDGVIMQTLVLGHRFMSICSRIKKFAYEKLWTLLQDEKPLNGSLKRKITKTIEDENGLETDIFSFEPVMTALRNRPMVSSASFIDIVSRYIRTQIDFLQIDIENKIPFKKFKLISANNDTKVESISLHEPTTELNLSQEMLQTFQDSLEKFLKELWKELFLGKKPLTNNTNSIRDLKKVLTEKNHAKVVDFMKKFGNAKKEALALLDSKPVIVEDEKESLNVFNSVQEKVNEEKLKCICGILREEGKMIQCDRCQVWQHFDCVEQYCNYNPTESKEYLCEVCDNRKVPTDIPVPPSTTIPNMDVNKQFNLQYYLSMESPNRKGFRIKVGDCVYIYRGSAYSANKKKKPKLEYGSTEIENDEFCETLKDAAQVARSNWNKQFNIRQCIIVRVQHMALIPATGQKILFGHHYLWPSETYHEPNRKFYPNEVLRSPVCEWAALEEVRGICFVMDPSTFIRGRPVGFRDEDLLICENRVDRAAKSFARIPKISHFPINTKSYAFQYYTEKLNIKRTYSPHQIPENLAPKPSNKKAISKAENATNSSLTEEERKSKEKKIRRLLKFTDRLNYSHFLWEMLFDVENLDSIIA